MMSFFPHSRVRHFCAFFSLGWRRKILEEMAAELVDQRQVYNLPDTFNTYLVIGTSLSGYAPAWILRLASLCAW